MSGRRPPGFLARTQRDVVLALPSRSGSASRRESQASVMGPARETPPSSPEQYAQEDGQNNCWEQSSGYDMWDDIQAESSQGHAEPYVPPGIAYTPVSLTTPPYTPAASYSSPYSPAIPSEYHPHQPVTEEELLQKTEVIVRNSQEVADAAYELNYNAQQLARV